MYDIDPQCTMYDTDPQCTMEWNVNVSLQPQSSHHINMSIKQQCGLPN